MLLENNTLYKIYQEIDISDLTARIQELNEDVWNIDRSRQVYGAKGGGPYVNTQSLILNHCQSEPHVDMSKALEYKEMFKDSEIPRKYMCEIIPSMYRSREDFKKDVKNIEKRIVDETLNKYTDNIIEKLEQQFNGIAGMVVYERLPAGAEIYMHYPKTSYYHTVIHKFHIPIITNDQVKFNFNDDTVNMKQGVLYEINTQYKHNVMNSGSTDRIHLVIDIIPKDSILS